MTTWRYCTWTLEVDPDRFCGVYEQTKQYRTMYVVRQYATHSSWRYEYSARSTAVDTIRLSQSDDGQQGGSAVGLTCLTNANASDKLQW